MTTTSVKLPAELKSRASRIAKAREISPHAFLLNSIEQATAAAERRQAFIQVAIEAGDQAVSSGSCYEAKDVHAYLKEKVKREAGYPGRAD